MILATAGQSKSSSKIDKVNLTHMGNRIVLYPAYTIDYKGHHWPRGVHEHFEKCSEFEICLLRQNRLTAIFPELK